MIKSIEIDITEYALMRGESKESLQIPGVVTAHGTYCSAGGRIINFSIQLTQTQRIQFMDFCKSLENKFLEEFAKEIQTSGT